MSRAPTLDRTLRIAACLGAILAAGCGGGGDEAPLPPELLQITSQNQVAVARAAAVNFAGLGSVRDVPLSGPAGAAQAGAAAGLTKQALGKAAAAVARPLATMSMTEACPVSGTVTLTLDDRDNDTTPSAGDRLTMTFTDCRDTASSLIRGSFSMDITAYAEPALSGLLTFGQLTVVDDVGSVAIDGQANFDTTTSADATFTTTTRIAMTVAAAGLVNSVSIPGYSETLTLDAGFSATWNDVAPLAQPGYTTATLNGRVHAASLGGRVVLATDPPVHDWWAEEFPDSGKVLVTGHQSRLQLTVLNTASVRLELDADNDGTFESSRELPWSELLPF